MRILILGSTSFIGSEFARFATERGHEIVGLSRSGKATGPGEEGYPWEFGRPIPSAALERVACAIHLAYDFQGAAGARLTIDSTLDCIDQIRRAEIPRQIFFSSYSAGEHAISLYGKTKFAIERSVIGCSDCIIVRPGLVIGKGGIYGRIAKWAKRLPIIPLPDGGRGKVPVIGIERLCRETLRLSESDLPERESNIFEMDIKTLRQLVREAAAGVGRRPIILPIPARLLMLGLRTLEFLRVPIPIRADNLAGFLANQESMHVSTLRDRPS